MLQKNLNVGIDWCTCALLHAFQRKKGRPLLIGASQFGRIGNRLYLGAHLIAWAKKKDAILLNPGFHDYENLFEGTYRDALVRFPEPSEPLRLQSGCKEFLRQSIERISIRLLNRESPVFQTIDLRPEGPDIADPTFVDRLIARPVTFIRGFVYNNTCRYIVDAYPSIQRYFRPRRDLLPAIEEPINNLRGQVDVVLGVVIRHGDFKSWQGGQFYHESEDYIQLMDQAVTALKGKRVGFFIASDEDQNPALFAHHTFYFRSGHPAENLCALASCDGMIAAESSFTGWSQYYGQVPVYHISRNLDSNKLQQMAQTALEKSRARRMPSP